MRRRHDEGDGRDRVLTPDEINAVWRAANEVGGDFADVLKLGLLTGLRLRDVLHARADEIHLDEKLWSIHREPMNAGRVHVVPLSDMALEIVRRRIKQATTPFLS